MSSSVKTTQNKAPNPSAPPTNSAWSRGPPQSSATSRSQSPANAPNTAISQPRRQSTLGPNAPQAVKQAARGAAAGTGHRSVSSINFGSIEPTQTPEKKAETATAPVPATPATAPKPAQPTNGIKVVAPIPTQPVPPASASTAPATTTAPTTASTAPAVAATPPGTTPTPSKQKKVNVHALFQGGGMPSVTTTPPVATSTPSTSAPAPVATPSAPPPRGAPSAFNDRNNPVQFPRSPQISRPTLPGPSTSGGQRPAGSPRMTANVPLQHQHPHQHPMAHPHPHHSPHPGHPMQAPPQWGPTAGYYYPHDYNPYMYWGGHPQHPHPHMPQMHQPAMQSSPRPPAAQPRPPSTPPVPNNVSPHPPPINTSLQAPPSVPSPSLSVTAQPFVPGNLRRAVNPIRISTPNGDAVTFEGQIPGSPKVTTPIPPKRSVVRMETEQQKTERLAKEQEEKDREAREKAEKERKEKERIEEQKRAKEEAERKEKEEAERKVREEQERKAREEAERLEAERKAKEEAERKAEEERKAKEEEARRVAEELRAKQEAERKAKEEEERKAKEEAERLEAEQKAKEEAARKAEEERKAKEEAEAAARAEAEAKAKEEAEKARAEAEAKAKEEAVAKEEAAAKEEAEAKEAAAEEARDTVPASPIASPKTTNGLLPSTVPDRPSPLSASTTPGRPSPLSISTTTNERPKRPVPGPLDLTSAQGNRSAAPPSALASARIIEDLNVVPYPETIKTPNPDLNIAATPGKFRYDRDFLLQFMGVCKERPDSLPALDVIGLEPGEAGAGYANTGRTDRRRVGSLGMSNAPPLQRQASIGLGLGSGLANRSGFAMGNFQSPSNSQSRFEASNPGRPGGMPFAGGPASRLTPMSRSASQGGVGGGSSREAKRTRSQRGRDRGDNPRASGFQTPANQVSNFEPVVPLEQSENRWVAGSTQRNPQQIEERQLVDRKVKALLNKLTMEKFDSISDQIIEWANKSEQEKDGSTLMQVIKLVFEKAKDEAAFSEMYARLCRKMMERVSPNVQDETIKNADGQPITGGMLFRKYLLNRCQEDFERGWSAKEAALAAAALKSGEDKAAEAASGDSGEAVLYSEEYYAAAKAKRQGLGLVRFIGELFKLQMLTERIMHECIKKLLSNVVNPEEEEIESLCKLLTTVGQSLDNPKARNHMDIYFERMQDMAKSSNINSRMQFMLLDVIEFRSRNWQARSALPRPAPSHQDSRDDGRHGVSRGGSRRGEHRGNATEPDGWNVAGGTGAARPTARAGDLSQFGKISKPTGIQFGPSSVFNKKEASKRDSSIGRAGGANMFSALSAADGPPPPIERTTSSRKPSVDLGPGGSPATAGTGERRKLVLQPRTKPAEAEAEANKAEDKEEDKEEAAPAAMTEEEAANKVKEDVKEYLGVENIDEAIMALEALPSEHRHLFVDKLVSASMDGGNKVVVLAEKLFSAAHSRSVISPDGFERGMLPTIEMADDLSIDVPKTYEWLARMIHAAGLDRAKTEDMAARIAVYGEPRVPPRELLIKEFEKVSSA